MTIKESLRIKGQVCEECSSAELVVICYGFGFDSAYYHVTCLDCGYCFDLIQDVD